MVTLSFEFSHLVTLNISRDSVSYISRVGEVFLTETGCALSTWQLSLQPRTVSRGKSKVSLSFFT